MAVRAHTDVRSMPAQVGQVSSRRSRQSSRQLFHIFFALAVARARMMVALHYLRSHDHKRYDLVHHIRLLDRAQTLLPRFLVKCMLKSVPEVMTLYVQFHADMRYQLPADSRKRTMRVRGVCLVSCTHVSGCVRPSALQLHGAGARMSLVDSVSVPLIITTVRTVVHLS